MKKLKYNRILLKLSGEILMGDKQFGFDREAIESLCQDIKAAKDHGAEVCIVVGGGNICRGATLTKIGIERVSADYIGMMATVMNAIALQSMLEAMGVETRVQSAIAMTAVCEPYIRRRAIRHMTKGRVVIFAAGTGYPYVTTDTSSTLRALEMGCDAILKGTQVDGVYTEDPKKNPDAVKFDKIDYKDVLTMNLQVMDSAAIGLARDNKVPILIFDIHAKGELTKVLQGTGNCTVVE